MEIVKHEISNETAVKFLEALANYYEAQAELVESENVLHPSQIQHMKQLYVEKSIALKMGALALRKVYDNQRTT